MRISDDEVRATAALARLALTDEEVRGAARDLEAILGAMEALQALNVDGIAPMTHPVPLASPRRPDVVGGELSVEAALADAPAREGGLFQVPRVVAHDKDAP